MRSWLPSRYDLVGREGGGNLRLEIPSRHDPEENEVVRVSFRLGSPSFKIYLKCGEGRKGVGGGWRLCLGIPSPSALVRNLLKYLWKDRRGTRYK